MPPYKWILKTFYFLEKVKQNKIFIYKNSLARNWVQMMGIKGNLIYSPKPIITVNIKTRLNAKNLHKINIYANSIICMILPFTNNFNLYYVTAYGFVYVGK